MNNEQQLNIAQKLIEAAEKWFSAVHNNRVCTDYEYYCPYQSEDAHAGEIETTKQAFKQLAQEVEQRESLWRELSELYENYLNTQSVTTYDRKRERFSQIDVLRKQLGLTNEN